MVRSSAAALRPESALVDGATCFFAVGAGEGVGALIGRVRAHRDTHPVSGATVSLSWHSIGHRTT